MGFPVPARGVGRRSCVAGGSAPSSYPSWPSQRCAARARRARPPRGGRLRDNVRSGLALAVGCLYTAAGPHLECHARVGAFPMRTNPRAFISLPPHRWTEPPLSVSRESLPASHSPTYRAIRRTALRIFPKSSRAEQHGGVTHPPSRTPSDHRKDLLPQATRTRYAPLGDHRDELPHYLHDALTGEEALASREPHASPLVGRGGRNRSSAQVTGSVPGTAPTTPPRPGRTGSESTSISACIEARAFCTRQTPIGMPYSR